MVLQAEDRQFGLVVDGINDTQEIVVKPLGKQLKGLTVYAGATIMGDGRVALILDVLGIGQRSGVLAESREQARAAAEQKTQAGIEQQRLLLFRAGSFERLAVPLSLVARLEEFPRSVRSSMRSGARWCSTEIAFFPWCPCGRAGTRRSRSGSRRPIRCR